MTDRSRVYYYFIIGACGGLTGWYAGSLLIRELALTPNSAASQMLYGGILGGTIGIAVAAYDGIMNRSALRFIKYGSIGLVLGALAGSLALLLVQWLYGVLLAAGTGSVGKSVPLTILIGTFCWLLFGGLIGFGEGISKGTQSWKGLLGGVIGGLCGGLLYEINRAASSSSVEDRGFRYQIFLASSVLLLGAAISAAIALVTAALKSAWVEIVDGKFAGRTYDVTKYVDPILGSHRAGIIGSDQWGAHIYLPADSEVLPRHAEISFANGAPNVVVTAEAAKRSTTFINGRRLTAASPLSDGDELRIGSTKLIYRQKRR